MQLRMQIPDFRNANLLDVRIWEIVHVNPYGLAHVFDFQDANFLDIRIWKIVHINPKGWRTSLIFRMQR